MGKNSNEVKETAYEVALADVAMKELKQFRREIVPFRNSWIDDVTRDTGVLENRVAGQVNADVAQQKVRALPVGIDPSSGAALSVMPSLSAGSIAAKAAVGATQGVRDQKAVGLQAGLNVMRGENVDAQAGMQGLAADSVNKAIGDAQRKRNTTETWGSSVTSALFAGGALYGNLKKPGPGAGPETPGLGFSLDPPLR